MKFNCGPSWYEKHLAKEQWHDFFPLWPRRVGDGDCRWLEYIERKGDYRTCWASGGWSWEYRAKERS